MEIWKQTSIRPDYEVSNFGRVRRKKRGPSRLWRDPDEYSYIKHRLCRNGYCRVKLNRKEYGLHRLVAIAFIENVQNKPEVNHIDGNKQNNNLSNLEWVTKEENMKHAHSIGLVTLANLSGENNPNYKHGKYIR